RRHGLRATRRTGDGGGRDGRGGAADRARAHLPPRDGEFAPRRCPLRRRGARRPRPPRQNPPPDLLAATPASQCRNYRPSTMPEPASNLETTARKRSWRAFAVVALAILIVAVFASIHFSGGDPKTSAEPPAPQPIASPQPPAPSA